MAWVAAVKAVVAVALGDVAATTFVVVAVRASEADTRLLVVEL
jgi:hypothetical protein